MEIRAAGACWITDVFRLHVAHTEISNPAGSLERNPDYFIRFSNGCFKGVLYNFASCDDFIWYRV